jgi:hypothetical protein
VKTIEQLLDSLENDAPVRQILVGAFWTGVVLDTNPPRCGLASTLRAETGGPWPPVVEAGRFLERGSGKRIAIVGHFPFIERARSAAADCWVLELHPAPGDLPASRAPELLPQADVVALTGTSLINHTFDDLIGLCRPDAFVLLLGPSTPLTPVLFEAGVDAISGTRVHDPELVLRSVTQGATFRQIKRAGGLRLLTWLRA